MTRASPFTIIDINLLSVARCATTDRTTPLPASVRDLILFSLIATVSVGPPTVLAATSC